MVYLGSCGFEVLMVLWFVFCVSGIVAKVLNMLVFPSLLGFCVVACSCLFGFGRFRCSVVLVFAFLLFRFCFCLFWLWFALSLDCCWIVVGVVLVLLLFFEGFCWFSFLFLFFGGFKGQVRWPKGPPHLALNTPYFFVFVFWFFCVFVWRV